jgi:D-alanyl-D-alanine carboxypeptidase (penicillin-binding protein 5/6)
MPRDRFRPRVRRVVLALLFFALAPGAASARAGGDTPEIHAASYIVVDATTGDVMAARDPDRPLPVASLQKILTALIAVEHSHPGDLVRISKVASHAQADHIIWPDGETFTVEELLYGMLVESSNGAAIALAEHVAGSQSAFAALMNEKAAELGATHSRFVNPNGLDALGQRSTAHDIAIFEQALLADPFLAMIVRTTQHEIPWPDGTITTLHSINRFLLRYPGAIGVKTGFTSIAGNCLAAAAHRNGRTVIAVLVHSTSVTEDASTLIDAALARLGPGPAEESAAPVVAPRTAARSRAAGAQVEAGASHPSPWEGRLPSKPGLAIVFAASGIVVVRRTRERRAYRRR